MEKIDSAAWYRIEEAIVANIIVLLTLHSQRIHWT